MKIVDMSKGELNKLRSSTLYDSELYVIYTGNYVNFAKNIPIKVQSKYAMSSGLDFPFPKWEASDFYIIDLDGDVFTLVNKRFDKLPKGFKWLN